MNINIPILVLLLLNVWTAQAEIRDSEGLTALHKAAGNGDLLNVKRLVENGSDVYSVDSRMGYSVLHKAVYSGNPEVVRYLLDKGALIDLQNPGNGDTPLLDALYFKKKKHGKELIDILLKAGANLSVRSRAGFTPLEAAKVLKDAEATKQIEDEMGRRFTPKGAALMKAVKSKDLKSIQKCLSDAKTPVDEVDIDGFTPLLWTAREGMKEAVELLLSHGANPNHLDVWMGANAGHKAAYWGRTEVMKLLVKTKMDINARGLSNGYTPLHDAVSGGHLETATVLLNAGAKLDLHGHDGLTGLDIAQANGNEALVQLLSAQAR